MAILRDSLLKG